jgi:hypothetical protein
MRTPRGNRNVRVTPSWLSGRSGESAIEYWTSRPRVSSCFRSSCDLFNKAFTHIADKIDTVYKDLTKGNNAPTGGVAYLSLEESDVSLISKDLPSYATIFLTFLRTHQPGTISERNQVSRNAAYETFPGYGTAVGGRKNHGCVGATIRHPYISAFTILRA